MNESRKKINTLSHTEIKCKQCATTVQKRSLAEHYSRYHNDCDHRESLVTDKNNLHSFFGLKRPADDEPGPSDAKQSKANDSEKEIGKTPEVEQLLSCVTKNPENATDMTKVLSRLNTLEANQKRMLNTLKSNSQHDKKKESMSNSKKNSNKTESGMTTITNVDELLSGIDWLVSCEDENFIRCTLCTEIESAVDATSRGLFSTNQEFRYLKAAVKGHKVKQSHIENLKKLSSEASLNLKILKRNEVIGYTLGGIAYQIIYHSETLSSFPRRVALLAQNAIDVGTTNHSKAFPTSLITPFKNQISMKLKERVKTPLP